MLSPPLLMLVLALAQDPGSAVEPALGPSPPPDRYDRAYDAALYAAFGGKGNFDGPLDKRLPEQAAPLRPDDWLVYAAGPEGPGAWSELALCLVVASEPGLPLGGEPAKMPADGPLAGAFVWATAQVDSPTDEVRFLRAPGAEIVFVNGEGFIGDPERCGSLGVPVAIRKGPNTLHVGGVRDGFELELWKPMTRIVMSSWALEFDAERDPWYRNGDELHVPLFNAALEPAEEIHFHYGRARSPDQPPRLGEWADGRFAAPLALALGVAVVFGPDWSSLSPESGLVLAPASAYVEEDRHGDRRLLPIDMGGPRPRSGAGERQAWPTRLLEVWEEWWPALLVYETSGPAEDAASTLAVARYTQQRIWSRTGDLPMLVSDAWLEAELNGRSLENIRWIVRIGRLDAPEPGVLVARRESGSEQEYSIRGSDAAALRLVYVVDPFFQAFDGTEWSWRVP